MNDEGETTALFLTGIHGGGTLLLRNDEGMTRVALMANEKGGNLALWGDAGTGWRADPDRLQLAGSTGRPYVSIGRNEDGAGSVSTYNKRNKKTVELSTDDLGHGLVTVHDPTGRTKRGVLTTQE